MRVRSALSVASSPFFGFFYWCLLDASALRLSRFFTSKQNSRLLKTVFLATFRPLDFLFGPEQQRPTRFPFFFGLLVWAVGDRAVPLFVSPPS